MRLLDDRTRTSIAVRGPRCPTHSPRKGTIMQSTIILVHGAFAESSSWHAVAAKLTAARTPRHRLRQPPPFDRARRGRPHRARPDHRRPGRARRPLLRRGRHHERPRRRRSDRRSRLRRRLRARRRREPWRRGIPRSRRDTRRHARARAAPGWRCRSLHRAGQVPRAVLRRSARTRRRAAGGQSATDRGGSPDGAVGRVSACGGPCRAGSSSATTIATSRLERNGSWPSAPAPSASSRSPAHRTWSASHTRPRRPI